MLINIRGIFDILLRQCEFDTGFDLVQNRSMLSECVLWHCALILFSERLETLDNSYDRKANELWLIETLFQNRYLDRPLRGSDFCSDMGEMSEEVLDVP